VSPPSDRKPALRSAIAASVFNRSRVIASAGRAESPSARRRRRTGRGRGEAAHVRSWLRSPVSGTPCPPRASSNPRPERRRSGRRLTPVRSRKSWVYSAPELRNGKAQSGQGSNFGAKFLILCAWNVRCRAPGSDLRPQATSARFSRGKSFLQQTPDYFIRWNELQKIFLR